MGPTTIGQESRIRTCDLTLPLPQLTADRYDSDPETQRVYAAVQALIDTLLDELVVVDLEGTIRLANRAAQERYAPQGDLVGQPERVLFETQRGSTASDHSGPARLVLERGEPIQMGYVLRDGAGGRRRDVHVSASPLRDAEGKIHGVVELLRDVTEASEVEQALRRRNEQLAALNQIAATLNQSLDLTEVLGNALITVLEQARLNAGAIFLREDPLAVPELVAHHGFSDEAAQLASRLGLLDGDCGGVIDYGQMVIVPDLSQYRGRRARSLRHEKLHNLIHVPLISKAITLGSFCAGTKYHRDFSVEDEEFLTAIGQQIAAAIDNARLHAEVQRREELRRKLLDKVMEVQEDERKRIARELHDETCQTLTALLYALEQMSEDQPTSEARPALDAMQRMVQKTLDDVYEIISDLRPAMLDQLGLVAAIQWFAESRLAANGVRVKLEVSPDPPPRMLAGIELALFRIVQEAITNIQRHAAARHVWIRLQFTSILIEILVEDDGVGFDPSTVETIWEGRRGWGLLGMSERVELLGGCMTVEAALHRGTQIHLRIPILQSEEVDA